MTKQKTPQAITIANKVLGRFLHETNPLADQKNGTWKLRNIHYSKLTQDDKGREYLLWPIPTIQEFSEKSLQYPFYLGFALELLPDDSIKEINIKVFREVVTQSYNNAFIPTELLLRAEWSNTEVDEEATRVHAQPHWHIHSYQVIDRMGHLLPEKQKAILELIEGEQQDVESILEEMDEEVAVSAGSTKEIAEFPMFRFHLAMVADWHNKVKDNRNKILDQATLSTWLPQCLDYIKDQLEYILKKLPQ